MSVFSWWRDLRKALREVVELKEIERKKIVALQECDDLDAATMCIESIATNVRNGDTNKRKKKEKST